MLYIIGLGLNEKGISQEGFEIVKRCKRVYLENYTVDFPYSFEQLKHQMNKKIVQADRDFIEKMKFLDESKKMDVALLVYGSPLIATTHITIIDEAKKEGIKCKVIHGGSVFDAIGETGLQLYKFGKITSMPKWKKNFEPDSFIKIIKDNQKINSHSLILMDIGLEFQESLEQLKKTLIKHDLKCEKIVVCSRLGARKGHIFYDTIESFEKNLDENKIRKPFCIIIPGKMHFLEKEFLERN